MGYTFREYVAHRDSKKNEDLSWLPGAIHSVPLWGWAAGAVALAAFQAFRIWAKKNAQDKKEFRYMADWWRTMDILIERYGPDSEQVRIHMKATELHPYDALKSMAETHLKAARKEAEKKGGEDLFGKYDKSDVRKPAKV